MDHGPAVELAKDNASGFKQKLGLILFFVYLFVYSGFVLINTIQPKLMGLILFSGLNLAVVYGIGLILFAIVLGLAYDFVATRYEYKVNGREKKEAKGDN
jgi:uncharacterized membrane protein (DUF485 family)